MTPTDGWWTGSGCDRICYCVKLHLWSLITTGDTQKRFPSTVESIVLSGSLTGLPFSSQCTIVLGGVDLLALVWLQYEKFDPFLVVSIGLFPSGPPADKHVSCHLYLFDLVVLDPLHPSGSDSTKHEAAGLSWYAWSQLTGCCGGKSCNVVIRSCEEESQDVCGENNCGEQHSETSSHPDSIPPPPWVQSKYPPCDCSCLPERSVSSTNTFSSSSSQ